MARSAEMDRGIKKVFTNPRISSLCHPIAHNGLKSDEKQWFIGNFLLYFSNRVWGSTKL
jgi:hypothetical protein